MADRTVVLATIGTHIFVVAVVFPLLAYATFIYTRFRAFRFIKRRNYEIVIFWNVITLFGITVYRPIQLYHRLFKFPYYKLWMELVVWMFLTPLGMSLMLTRVWLLYFDYKHHMAVIESEWRKELSNDAVSWFIRHENTMGSVSFCIKVSLVFSVSMCAFITVLGVYDNPTHEPNPAYFTALSVIFFLFFLAFVAFYFLTRACIDVYSMRAEAKQYMLSIFVIYILYTLLFNILLQTTSMSEYWRDLLSYILLENGISISYIYISTINVLNIHHIRLFFNRNVLASMNAGYGDEILFGLRDEEPSVSGTSTSTLSRLLSWSSGANTPDLASSRSRITTRSMTDEFYGTFNSLLSQKLGLHHFMAHLYREFCAENMLFIVEVAQVKKAIAEAYAMDTSDQVHRLHLPDTIPSSDIVNDIVEPREMCKAIFEKYVAVGTRLEINVDWVTRDTLIVFFLGEEIDDDDAFNLELKKTDLDLPMQKAKPEDLYQIFDEAETIIFRFLRTSFRSFRSTAEYTRLEANGVYGN